MRCLIVDDDKVVRKLLSEFVEMRSGLELVASCEDAIEASNLLREKKVDLIFLDMEMPGMSGLDLVRSLSDRPQIIVISGEKKYAVDAFDEELTDYVVKPVSYARFLKAVERAEKRIESKPAKQGLEQSENPDVVFVKVNGRLIKIKLAEIKWIEAQGDYVLIQSIEDSYLVLTTMKSILARLPESQFARSHRKYIVRIDAIEDIEDMSIVIGRKLIPVGASHKQSLMERLNTI